MFFEVFSLHTSGPFGLTIYISVCGNFQKKKDFYTPLSILIYIPIVAYHHGCFGSWISVLKDDQECIFWKWEMHQSAKVYQRARGTKEINDTIGLTQIGYSSAHHFFLLSLSYFSLSLSIHDKVSSSVKKVAYSITC